MTEKQDKFIETYALTGKTSKAGAYGLAQFLPSTWKGLQQDARITFALWRNWSNF